MTKIEAPERFWSRPAPLNFEVISVKTAGLIDQGA